MTTSETQIERAVSTIKNARTLIVTAGAGMGVDSGLPDFRGNEGFWNAYPVYAELGINFMEMATPRHFAEDPSFGWGFYGHRTNLYRQTVPHQGFNILLDWIRHFNLASFVITSNVDGQFQKAGFVEDQIYEVHGSIHCLQCLGPCRPTIWPNEEIFEVDQSTMRCQPIPSCKFCTKVARPNVLMFNDFGFIPIRSNDQEARLAMFLSICPRPITVIEFGAGKAVPTIRWTSESIGRTHDATIIRVNPRESEITEPHISLAMNALPALERIAEFI